MNYDFVTFDEKFDACSQYSSDEDNDIKTLNKSDTELEQKNPIKRELRRGTTFHYPPNFDEENINVTKKVNLSERHNSVEIPRNNNNIPYDNVKTIIKKKIVKEEKLKIVPKIKISTPEKLQNSSHNTSRFCKADKIHALSAAILLHPNILSKPNEIENNNLSTTPLSPVDSSNLDYSNKAFLSSIELADNKTDKQIVNYVIPVSSKILAEQNSKHLTSEFLSDETEERKNLFFSSAVKNEEDPHRKQSYDYNNLDSLQNLNHKDDPNSESENENETPITIKKHKVLESKLRDSEKYANIGWLLLPDDTFREIWDFMVIM